MILKRTLVGLLVFLAAYRAAAAQDTNLKIVTDASPDYSDMPSMVRSITSNWPAPREKCWAMFYWNHLARRQTTPVELHGLELTDAIRQFNDYGYTMCSTISGTNCGIWHNMGLPAKFWDISNHTVAEVFYDGRWHMYDNSLSAIYTLCDGKTLAGVADIGKPGACEASAGREEPGHVAKYHCLTSTGPNGFLSGADCARALDEEFHCFNPNGLKHRAYYMNWDFGHRYVLNLREREAYTRYFRSLGREERFFVPNHGKDPEAPNARYRIRGNGLWTWSPSLAPADLKKSLVSATNVVAREPSGLCPGKAGQPAEAVFKVSTANVATGQTLRADLYRKSPEDAVKISVSTTNGLSWREVWTAEGTGALRAKIDLVGEVSGSYEILIKVSLRAGASAPDARLDALEVETVTMVNSKTQPRLNLGKNTVYVGAGEATDSIVLWPELQGDHYKELIVEERNVASLKRHPGYFAVLHPTKPKEDCYVVYRIDAPNELTRLTLGGRFYNRVPKSRCDVLYSVDGNTWTTAWSLAETQQPWDVIHYETVDLPRGNRSAWVKYQMNSPAASEKEGGCGLYAVRMEANHLPLDPGWKPLEVTYSWSEVQKDRSLVRRSHAELVEKVPFTYEIHVGGEDHPVMESLAVRVRDARGERKYGYSDGKDAGGEKFVGRRLSVGRNLALGKSYTLSHPSLTNWGAGDPEGKKLTDGAGGPPYAGGISYQYGVVWGGGTNPAVTLDLGTASTCASFGMNFHGYPCWDAMKGEVKDKVEVLVSDDGKDYRSVGFLKTDLRWKDLPANHFWPDEETLTGATFRVIPEKPVTARFVRYAITSERFFDCTELEVLDSIALEPFDLRLALPGEKN